MVNFYFDTSIWLDLFENRNEPNFPKGENVKKLITKIIQNNNRVLFSNNNFFELITLGYTKYEINSFLNPFRKSIYYVWSTEKQFRKAKDLALKRNIPKRDALHALIARDNKAVLITLDKHFQYLRDIVKIERPQNFI